MNRGEIILQWNSPGFTSAKEDLLKLIEDFTPCVITIQKTWYRDDRISKLGGYNVVAKQGHFNRRYLGRVSIYIHNEVQREQLKIESSVQVTAARFNIGYQNR